MVKLVRHSTRISCLVELSTGLPLVLVPGVVMTLLFGSPVSGGGHQAGPAVRSGPHRPWDLLLVSQRAGCQAIQRKAWIDALQPRRRPVSRWLCRHRRSAGTDGWPCWLAASRSGAADVAGSEVGGTAEAHVTSCCVKRLAHQSRRPKTMAVLLSAEKRSPLITRRFCSSAGTGKPLTSTPRHCRRRRPARSHWRGNDPLERSRTSRLSAR